MHPAAAMIDEAMDIQKTIACCSPISPIVISRSAIMRPGWRQLRNQPAPFQYLPPDEARPANREVGSALDQRQSDRLSGRNSEDRAQQYEAALLRAERTRNRKSGPANCVQEALDDEGFPDTYGVVHTGEYDQHFGYANDPADEVGDPARDQVASPR